MGLPQATYRVDPLPEGQSSGDDQERLTRDIRNGLARAMGATVLVYGDLVESVCAARAASSSGLRTLHIEAGLRSLDPEDSEESHRIEIDELAVGWVTHSATAVEILVNSGKDPQRIVLTASPLISTLRRQLAPAIRVGQAVPDPLRSEYVLVTYHRPENIHNVDRLTNFADLLNELAEHVPVVFLVYGSTRRALGKHGIRLSAAIKQLDTQDYDSYLALLLGAAAIVTDSSGLQDETSFLGIPCFTARASTHRFDTITRGSNRLIGSCVRRGAASEILASMGSGPLGHLPAHWWELAGPPIIELIRT